jgi:mannitol operon repressor
MAQMAWEDAPPEILTLATFLQRFYKESDRGAALLAGSMLDEIALRILRAFLIEQPESEKLLEGFNAPLGSFNARLVAAYSLGLIETEEYNQANTVRKVRNEFAHGWGDLAFEDAKVAALVELLPRESREASTTARYRFNATVANLLGVWLWREQLVKGERRAHKAWPNKSGFLPR